jgi:hypothetical protein
MSIKLPAQDSVDVLVHGYCLDYGAPFPGQELKPLELAPDVIRNTVCYNIAKGYVEDEIWQAQLAIWRQTDQLDQGPEFPLVDEIADYAESGVEPGDIGSDCVPLPDAVEEGLISADVSEFVNTTDPEYFGKGKMVLVNLTDKEQNICLPYATAYKDETQTGVQDMAVYPDQRPDLQDLEEPQVLPEAGSSLSSNELYSLLMLAVGVLLVGSGFALRRLSRANRLVP